ncbi:hypothetical protein AWB64_05598 [Caballeronia sordidicola]|uniref:DUF3564 family protein n=1 Tax=Caballeronia sordidicola TaxID=196367 RepID=A0A158I7X2_CABSO|nr:DUF3564 family protein [Caballeronia sordidicola]SAL52140.1 hypothetical protein AWB64_05598 [Caballeronia sordidicola]
MRITMHIDTFDRVSPCGYAILEIDKDTRRWVLSSQCGVTLSHEGSLIAGPNGTVVCGPSGAQYLCVLEGLDTASAHGPFEGETGAAMWYADLGIQPVAGHWHVELTEDCEGPLGSSAANKPR